MSGAELIIVERHRQINEEGWTERHDRFHNDRELTRAAISYLLFDIGQKEMAARRWPWAPEFYKPGSVDTVRNLVRAGALIAAEIDQLHATAPRYLDCSSRKGGLRCITGT